MVQKTSDNNPRVFDFYYCYPEHDLSLVDNQEEMKVHVRRCVEELYGTPSPAPYIHLDDISDGNSKLARSIPEDIRDAISNQRVKVGREWQIDLRVKKDLIPENFTIFFFLGEPEEGQEKWSISPKKLGIFTTFKSSTVYCSNCARQEESFITGGANITHELYNAISLGNNGHPLHDEDFITGYLKKNLTWKMIKHDGTIIDIEELLIQNPDGLHIEVDSFFLSRMQPGQEYRGGDQPDIELVGKVFDSHPHLDVTEDKKKIGGEGLESLQTVE